MGSLVNAQVNYFRMDAAAMSQETSCADNNVFWNREIYLTVSFTNGKVSYLGYVTEGD